MNPLSAHDVVQSYKDTQIVWQMLWYDCAKDETEVPGLSLGPLRQQLEMSKKEVENEFGKLKPLLERIGTIRREKTREEVFASVKEPVEIYKRKNECLKRQLLVFNLVKRTCDGYREMESVWQKITESLSKAGREEAVLQKCQQRQISSPKKAYEAASSIFEKLKPLLQKIISFSAETLCPEDFCLAENLTMHFSEKREFLLQLLSVAS